MRLVVMVSGAPGAGKSTLALPLAQALAMPLLSKDVIKERLADVLGQRAEPEVWTQALGSASMELIWTLAALSPAVVLEANFRPKNPYERRMLSGLGGRLVEVYCRCPPEEASRRYSARSMIGERHAIHTLRDLPAALLAEYDGPVGLGAVIEVDTTVPVEIAALAASVRALLDDESDPGS
ncbi:AAA family ATPase [Phenylobacterium sp.]|uniref:AAA family ATPase n=1 Tax=Phenylobacterium sp. TaxID=1871053 RepID=UPI00271F2CC7|nr:AAA family ATPase [Phenylobacterium sp.]MDO8799552.1 AAA family ATPase [Phenylobacterium sp.]